MLYLCVLRVYVLSVCWVLNLVLKPLSLQLNKHILPTGIIITCLQFFLYLGSDLYQSEYLCLPEQSSHIFTNVLPKNLLRKTNQDTCFDSLSCLGFTDLVFFFFPETKGYFLSNKLSLTNNVICSICLNNSMSLLHLVPYSLYFACDISGLSQVFIHLGNCSFSFSCVPVLWVLIPFLFQDQNSKVLKKLLIFLMLVPVLINLQSFSC